VNFVHPPSESHLAARAVALHAPGTRAEQKVLLDILGLLSDDGQLQELPRFVIPAYQIDGSIEPRDASASQEPPWDRSSVPAGLRNLPPLPTVRRKSGPKPKPPREPQGCGQRRGTVNGRNWHRREGSPVCDDCRVAWNDAQRVWRKTSSPPLPPRPETCGTLAGRSNHARRGEKLCRACKDAANAHARARRARREQEKERDQEKEAA
jgi:hypothetical protein